MKIFLHEIEKTQEVLDKINFLNCEIIDDLERADLIVYSDTFQQMLLDLGVQESIHTYISIKDFLIKDDPFNITPVEGQKNCVEHFQGEDLGDVTKKIEKCIYKVYDKNSFSDLERYLKLISIELVQNALIHAKLNNLRGKIDYEIICGTENYAIVVKDSFGSLGHKQVLQAVHRAYSEKTYETKVSGAGLGLSMIVSASDELSILRKESEFTEIRSIINKYKRLKEYKSKKTSLLFRSVN